MFGFGDGRNTVLLCDCGLTVSGIEITQGIVEQTPSTPIGYMLFPIQQILNNIFLHYLKTFPSALPIIIIMVFESGCFGLFAKRISDYH